MSEISEADKGQVLLLEPTRAYLQEATATQIQQAAVGLLGTRMSLEFEGETHEVAITAMGYDEKGPKVEMRKVPRI